MYDINEIKKQFPMLTNNVKMQNKPLVFLDNCSTTFKPQCVIDAEMEYYTLPSRALILLGALLKYQIWATGTVRVM